MKKPPKPRCLEPEDVGVSRCWIGAILSIMVEQIVCRPYQLRSYCEHITGEKLHDILEKFENRAFLRELQEKALDDFSALCFWAAQEARCEHCRERAFTQFSFDAYQGDVEGKKKAL